jgi:hypothetical protein
LSRLMLNKKQISLTYLTDSNLISSFVRQKKAGKIT